MKPIMTRTAAVVAAVLVLGASAGLRAADKDIIPPQFSAAQRDNLLRFLQQHEKPERFVPRDAKIVGPQGANVDAVPGPAANKPVKQYTVQITPHRPVPDQEQVKRADVYYYRPNPEPGKAGITVRHTVDLDTGKQVGSTEVLLNYHTPISREELAEAVALAREKSADVRALYKDRAENAVQWEYLQLMIGRKHEPHEPGDRVVRFVFTAGSAPGEAPAQPVRVVANLTKGVVTKGDR
jgi:hypothetical protein